MLAPKRVARSPLGRPRTKKGSFQFLVFSFQKETEDHFLKTEN